jgi:hypothetical protein
VQLVVDGGWDSWAEDGVQSVLVDIVTVNNFKLNAKGFGKK